MLSAKRLSAPAGVTLRPAASAQGVEAAAMQVALTMLAVGGRGAGTAHLQNLEQHHLVRGWVGRLKLALRHCICCRLHGFRSAYACLACGQCLDISKELASGCRACRGSCLSCRVGPESHTQLWIGRVAALRSGSVNAVAAAGNCQRSTERLCSSRAAAPAFGAASPRALLQQYSGCFGALLLASFACSWQAHPSHTGPACGRQTSAPPQ